MLSTTKRFGSRISAAFLIAAIAFAPVQNAPASAGRLPAESAASSTEKLPPALHLMSDTEFAAFLSRFDAAQRQWNEQLKSVDVRSLSLRLEPGDRAALAQSYTLCLQSLQMTGQQTRELSQKQTMKGDVLLLVQMNGLARSLDELDRDLANAGVAAPDNAVPKALRDVREVLSINTALAARAAEFQNHVFAFAKLIDARLSQTDGDTRAPLPRS